jgi:hypothetical protein
MHRNIEKIVVCLGMLSIVLTGCDDSKPKPTSVLKEVIDVQGTCFENHVGQKARYTGQIVRWQAIDTGKISTYGFVSLPFTADRVIDEATHPTVYHMPFMVSLLELDIDTSQPKWTVRDVSDRGENSQGYDSTCELDVVKRGMEIRDDFKDVSAPISR